jgi:hypothetical protein
MNSSKVRCGADAGPAVVSNKPRNYVAWDWRLIDGNGNPSGNR